LSESRFAGRSYFLDGPDGREALGASYDDAADVLYLWRGDTPTEAISLPMDEGPIVRVDPETGDLVGVTLLDWSLMWADKARIELDVPTTAPSEREASEDRAPYRELVAV
jgi:hypothetical protein